MGGFRALTRHSNHTESSRTNKFNHKRTHKQAAPGTEGAVKKVEKQLRLINMTAEQETSRAVKFVFDELPVTKDAVDALLFTELKTAENVKIGLQRLREFYNPTVEAIENREKATENFGRFVHALLLSWLDLTESEDKEKKALVDPVCLHLKEMSAQTHASTTIVAYLSSQMENLTGVLQQVRIIEQSERDEESVEEQKRKMLPKFANSLLRLQRVMVDIMESPMCRLLDCLLALSTQTYQVFAQTFTEADNVEVFAKLAKNELAIMKNQKTTMFNPSLVALCLKLANSDKKRAIQVAQKISAFMSDSIATAPQIVCAEMAQYTELGEVATKRPRLEYLQLAKQKPKPIPTFAPFIDNDFLMPGHFKMRQKTDPKVIRGKLKKADKDAQRELKKDTMAIQMEKQKMQASKKKSAAKVFRGGNLPKDEI